VEYVFKQRRIHGGRSVIIISEGGKSVILISEGGRLAILIIEGSKLFQNYQRGDRLVICRT